MGGTIEDELREARELVAAANRLIAEAARTVARAHAWIAEVRRAAGNPRLVRAACDAAVEDLVR